MQREPRYRDVVAEVEDFLRQRVAAACAAGIEPGELIATAGVHYLEEGQKVRVLEE